jgi:cysteine-rich repeat protein
MRAVGLALAFAFAAACSGNTLAPPGFDFGADDLGDDSGTPTTCGNGVVDPGELCDDGATNGAPGDPCRTNCKFACLGAGDCDDQEPCNGAETCVSHACTPGAPLADGTACGTGMICRNQSCGAAVCGDGITTAPEECDDSNSNAGDGCENDCSFSCVSTDAARNCTPADACAGQGACNDTTHVCAPGTPLADGTACGTGGYCKTGVCTQPVCGNGTVEPGEQCDDGAANGTPTDGCKTNCTFACVNPIADCPPAPVCEKRSCSVAHVCTPVADPTQDNMACGAPNLICKSGACVAPTANCGNGVVEAGEQCDFGAGANGPGTGCETNCRFSCTIAPNSCPDANPCNGTETCGAVTVGGHAGQKCSAGTPLANGTSCGATVGMICVGGACGASRCGDGYVDAARGETCEPPGSATCDAMCHTIVCGDGVRAGSEQCDDGNLVALDGCDGACKFEQDHRVNSLSMPYGTVDTFCTKNALGGAIAGGVAQNTITNSLTNGVTDGSITIMFTALGLDDLSGITDPMLKLGLLNGTHATGTAPYNGTMDLDWWYTTDAASIDAMRAPLTQIDATIAAKVLNASSPLLSLTINLGGVPAALSMQQAKLRANIGPVSTPLTSTGMTPGHLAAEHLDPALQSYASTTGGELCGNVTARSLANVPAPAALVGCTFTTCSQCYTATNTLLDIINSGCSTLLGTQIRATNPDGATVPTDKYLFTANAQHVITSCTKNGMPDTLANCLANATYSSFFRFTTDRVIAK